MLENIYSAHPMMYYFQPFSSHVEVEFVQSIKGPYIDTSVYGLVVDLNEADCFTNYHRRVIRSDLR